MNFELLLATQEQAKPKYSDIHNMPENRLQHTKNDIKKFSECIDSATTLDVVSKNVPLVN